MGLLDKLLKKKLKQTTKKENEGGPFLSFVLLDHAEFSPEQLAADLLADWGIVLAEEDMREGQDPIVCTIDGMMATVAFMPGPVPYEEVVENAKTNFRWPEAVEVTLAHRAHLLVAVFPKDNPLTDAGILLVKLCTSALRQPHATAINTAGSVFAPEFYIEYAKMSIKENLFPVMNLVFLGIYSRDGGNTFSGYTFGMRCFCKMEMEVLDSTHTASELVDFLLDIAAYIIEDDVTLQDGETIGFSAEQKLSITLSSACALDGESLKIGF